MRLWGVVQWGRSSHGPDPWGGVGPRVGGSSPVPELTVAVDRRLPDGRHTTPHPTRPGCGSQSGQVVPSSSRISEYLEGRPLFRRHAQGQSYTSAPVTPTRDLSPRSDPPRRSPRVRLPCRSRLPSPPLDDPTPRA